MASKQSQTSQGLPTSHTKKGLPNPYAAATVASAAPVRYSEEHAKVEQQRKAPAFHNPHNIKRPQAKKVGTASKKPIMPAVSSRLPVSSLQATSKAQHGYDWYRSTADDDAAFMEDRRQRNWEEKQRKKEQKKFSKKFGQWNPQAPFRPERPTNLRAYRASGGYARKKDSFQIFLDAQSRAQKSFVPIDALPIATVSPSTSAAKSPSPLSTSFENATVSRSDVSEEDARACRMRLLEQQNTSSFSLPPASTTNLAASVPLFSTEKEPTPVYTQQQHVTISAPPVHYAKSTTSASQIPHGLTDLKTNADDEIIIEQRPAKRARVSKAEAMMVKMGYKKGQGLGRNSDGVVTHLEVKIRKIPQGSSSFDEEGGKIKSQQVWDVRGGMRTQNIEPGKFGKESCIVVTWGCVESVDWVANADRDDGGIRQDMGEAFSKKFGPVEHIQLDESNEQGAVYIQFQSVLSALNAVNRFHEGWEFRGRKIRAQYYDERKFHAGIFDY